MSKKMRKKLENIFSEKCNLIVVSEKCGYFIFSSFSDFYLMFSLSCINLLRYLVYDAFVSSGSTFNKKELYSDIKKMSRSELFFLFLYYSSDFFKDTSFIKYFCNHFYSSDFIK